jgi:hypothetical protein
MINAAWNATEGTPYSACLSRNQERHFPMAARLLSQANAIKILRS